MMYNKMTLEECFIYYHTARISCECDADKKEIIFNRE